MVVTTRSASGKAKVENIPRAVEQATRNPVPAWRWCGRLHLRHCTACKPKTAHDRSHSVLCALPYWTQMCHLSCRHFFTKNGSSVTSRGYCYRCHVCGSPYTMYTSCCTQQCVWCMLYTISGVSSPQIQEPQKPTNSSPDGAVRAET